MTPPPAAPSEATISKLLDTIVFDENGLVPAIAQQHDTCEVLMMAWMNRDAVVETLKTGRSCYWSRSRRALWRKGETSGQIQALLEFRVDCDGDTILLQVDRPDPAAGRSDRRCLPHRPPFVFFHRRARR